MGKVLLISMPFGALEHQALGISLLKARLGEAGIGCDIRYLTFPFAGLIGYEEYQWMAYGLPYTTFAGNVTAVRRSDTSNPYAARVAATSGSCSIVARHAMKSSMTFGCAAANAAEKIDFAAMRAAPMGPSTWDCFMRASSGFQKSACGA